jgi:hypothetical protein
MLLSDVTRTSKPASSAAVSKSPFFKVAQPRSCNGVADVRMGKAARGVVVEQYQHGLEARSFVETMGGEVEYGFDLFARNGILLDDFINGHAVLKVLENELNRRPRVSERPGAAHLARDAFHGGAL